MMDNLYFAKVLRRIWPKKKLSVRFYMIDPRLFRLIFDAQPPPSTSCPRIVPSLLKVYMVSGDKAAAEEELVELSWGSAEGGGSMSEDSRGQRAEQRRTEALVRISQRLKHKDDD